MRVTIIAILLALHWAYALDLLRYPYGLGRMHGEDCRQTSLEPLNLSQGVTFRKTCDQPRLGHPFYSYP